MKKYAIIVAGGSGTRMGGDIPKQFMAIGGRTILVRTVEAFLSAFNGDIDIVLVLPELHVDMWRECCQKDNFDASIVKIAHGGKTRFHSVKNGLTLVKSLASGNDDALIGIHDGVRPLVSSETIVEAYNTAEAKGTAIPVIDSVDSIRSIQGNGGSKAEDRSKFKLVQTPQTFRLSVISSAYDLDYRDTFTDDASVVEANGVNITLSKGNRENVKMTTPFDLVVAEALLRK
ncbi:MAG: 2-C-methyl-D-erythritol 4-phosphate cytidylyltransferase [Paludibacteraceae bacterium]|nr:2-C-methyl-D-erythritol 4-phosphate cytidylyltransferase [Paludibacteraceae bacterium]